MLRIPYSIRGIVLSILLCALLPALGLIVYTSVSNRISAFETLETSTIYSARSAARQQGHIIDRTRSLLSTLAHLQEVAKADPQACAVIFQNLAHNSPVLVDIRLADLSGNVIASASKTPVQFTEQEKAAVLSDTITPVFVVYPSMEHSSLNKKLLLCVLPVRNEYGTQSLLVAFVSILFSYEDLSLYAQKGVSHLDVVDQNGATLFTKLFLENDEHEDITTNYQLVSQSTNEASNLLLEDVEVPRFIAYEKLRVSSFDEPYLTIMVVSHKENAFITMEQTLWISLVAFLLLSLISSLLVWWLLQKTVLTPVANLFAVTRELQSGDLHTRATTDSAALELAALGNAFNTMAIALENRNKELVEASEVATGASKTKSEFLANMSHEIRTPMNAILGMAYLAQRSDLTPRQKNYIDKIHSAATVLLAVINDILAFSKIEAGKLQLENISFNLEQQLQPFIASLRKEAEAKGLDFEHMYDSAIPHTIKGDPYHIGQVVENLLSNAVKYTETGKILFACQNERQTDDLVVLRFTISDTGRGFTPQQLEVYFPAQGDEQAMQAHLLGSSGLNIVVTRRIIELMGGELLVQSAPDEGTTVELVIPFQMGKEVDPSLIAMRGKSLSHFRVLVLCSRKEKFGMLFAMLDELCMHYTIVGSVEDAVTALCPEDERNMFHMVILDDQFVASQYVNLLEYIKTAEEIIGNPATVVLVGDERKQDMAKGGLEYADVLLYSPVDASTMFNALQGALLQTEHLSMNLASSLEDEVLPMTSSTLEDALTILVVEDNPINQQIIEEILQEAGATVEIADDGKAAVDILLAKGPKYFSVVLMDLQMPIMDGFEATRRIRQEANFAHLPIIAMTAHSKAEEWDQCEAAGMNDYASKPVDVTSLFATIKRWANKEAYAE